MPTCFVIQPFDKGKFDKRFRDVYEPAIRAAGFEPYRVDNDDGVLVPIDSIEDGIRRCAVCLADITSDNPNVWYELGFAFASNRPVVMVCSNERTGDKYPFDIQHRSIIPYRADAPSDFNELAENLTRRIKAVAERGRALQDMAEAQLVAPVEGLSQPELMTLAVLASGLFSPDSSMAVWAAKRDAEQAGVTSVGFNLGFRRLLTKGFVETSEAWDEDARENYKAVRLTDAAWEWVDKNEDKFMLHRERDEKKDDLPF